MEHLFSESCGRVLLKPLGKEDIEKARLLRNQTRNSFIDAREISQEEQERWFARYLQDPSELMFSVFLARSGQWIGTAALFHLSADRSSGECGRFIIDKTLAPEKGIGREAVEAACAVGFEQLKLQRLFLSVYEDNLPAVNCYRKAGFHEYGTSQDHSGRKLLLMERTGGLCIRGKTL